MRRLVLPVLLAAGLVGCGGGDGGGTGGGATTGGAGAPSAAATDGRTMFTETCGGCHTFTPAGTDGGQGPSLDGTTLDVGQIQGIVRQGLGSMPAFGGQLDEQQITRIAEYVAGGG